jgi:Tfp pilus assembly protein PilZ
MRPMSVHKRRDVRFAIRFPAQLSHKQRTYSLVTEDVSYGGVFLGTDTPPPTLQLVGVQLALPIGGRALKAHGMTVHVVEPGDAAGHPCGVGVQFYALDRETRETWEAFVTHVRTTAPRAHDQVPLRLARGQTPEPMRRSLGRHTAVLTVTPRTLEELEELYTRGVSTGGMFVPTEIEAPEGARVLLHVTHPDSGRPYLLEAKVVSRKTHGEPRGVGVEIPHTDRQLLEEFLDFVRGGVTIDDEIRMEPPSGSEG